MYNCPLKKQLNVMFKIFKNIATNFSDFAEYKNDFQRLLFTSKFCRIARLHFQTSQTSTEIVLHTEDLLQSFQNNSWRLLSLRDSLHNSSRRTLLQVYNKKKRTNFSLSLKLRPSGKSSLHDLNQRLFKEKHGIWDYNLLTVYHSQLIMGKISPGHICICLLISKTKNRKRKRTKKV